MAPTPSPAALAPRLPEFLTTLAPAFLVSLVIAVGMKTSLRTMLDVGGQAIILIVAETVFLAGFILIGLQLLGHGGPLR